MLDKGLLIWMERLSGLMFTKMDILKLLNGFKLAERGCKLFRTIRLFLISKINYTNGKISVKV